MVKATARSNANTPRPVQVFITFAWADREVAKRLALLLEQLDYVVWWERDLGAPESGAERAAANAPCVLALWTRASMTSRWVLEEAGAAAARGALVEVILEDVGSPMERPTRDPVRLAEWSGEADESAGWRSLLARVRTLAGPPLGRPIHKLPFFVAGAVVAVVAGSVGAVLTAPPPYAGATAEPDPPSGPTQLLQVRGMGGPTIRPGEPASAPRTPPPPISTPALVPTPPAAPPEPVAAQPVVETAPTPAVEDAVADTVPSDQTETAEPRDT